MLTYLPPQPGKEYMIGVDPAGGGSEGDYACAQVIDRSSGMQCAELRGHLTPPALAGRVAILSRQYNGAVVAVERNNHGHAVLRTLGMLHADAPLFRPERAGGMADDAATVRGCCELVAVLSAAPCLFVSRRLLEECRTFVRRPDGSTAAASGTHDDTVMAMAIAQVVRTEEVGKASVARAEVRWERCKKW